MDQQVAIEGFEFLRKDRMDTQNKTGGGFILYFIHSLKCKRRPEYEISKIETIWAEIELPNTKPFYRPPNAHSEWIDLFRGRAFRSTCDWFRIYADEGFQH